MFSFPINLMTLAPAVGRSHAGRSRARSWPSARALRASAQLRDWILAQVGEELYETVHPRLHDQAMGPRPGRTAGRRSSAACRSARRTTTATSTTGIRAFPIGGYTRLFENMLDHEQIDVELGVDYFEHDRDELTARPRAVGLHRQDRRVLRLSLRRAGLSLAAVRERSARRRLSGRGDRQLYATRRCRSRGSSSTSISRCRRRAQTVITREYPQAYERGTRCPYYPIRDAANAACTSVIGRGARRQRRAVWRTTGDVPVLRHAPGGGPGTGNGRQGVRRPVGQRLSTPLGADLTAGDKKLP